MSSTAQPNSSSNGQNSRVETATANSVNVQRNDREENIRTEEPPENINASARYIVGSIRLVGSSQIGHNDENRRLVWDDSVVNNEHLDKKKSKICCIFHKPKPFGESDSESSSDEEKQNAYERQPSTRKKSKRPLYHHSHNNNGHNHEHGH